MQIVSDYMAGQTRLETKAQWQRHSLLEVSDDACVLFPTIPSCLTGVSSTAAGAPPTEMTAFDLLLNTGTLDILAHHVLGEAIRGTAGLSGLYQKNDSHGPIFLVPDATVASIGAFAFEEATYDNWTISAGGRVDSRHLTATANPVLGLTSDDKRSWTVSTGNEGLVFRPVQPLALAANAGLAWRAPTIFELYSNGPLLAEGRYEVGDAIDGRPVSLPEGK